VPELVAEFGRNLNGITARLDLLGVLDPPQGDSTAARWPQLIDRSHRSGRVNPRQSLGKDVAT
jgi:hypothetical protein